MDKTALMEKAKCVDILDVTKDWTTFRNTISQGIQQARQFGMSDQEIQELAATVGDFLNEKVCPATKEEELLKEMWDVSSTEERKTLATILFKMMK